MLRLKRLILVSLIVSAACQLRWRSADDFRASLKCGMSADEVGILARKHGCSTFRTIESTHDGGDHALNKGSTVFWFWFSSGRLVSYQEGRYFGTTGLRMSVRQNLCTGQMAASVMLE